MVMYSLDDRRIDEYLIIGAGWERWIAAQQDVQDDPKVMYSLDDRRIDEYLIIGAGWERWIAAQQDVQDDPNRPDVNL